uniref:Protein kinase domain-containing protein n=1 Tax=Amphiprion percula TaxID=161767 RepID=A0A3P8RVR1_AMPPE
MFMCVSGSDVIHAQTNKGSRLGRYHVVEDILGEGGYGIVAKCRNTGTTKIEAVKVNKSEKGVLEVAMNEIAILNRLRRLNPDTCNIVQCNGFFYDKENICISFELLDLSLQDYLQEKNPRGLTTRELRPILHQLATALSHLHSSGIIHADLKPANVMVVNRHEQPPKVKLIDFGLARLVSASNPRPGIRRGSKDLRQLYKSMLSLDAAEGSQLKRFLKHRFFAHSL